MNETPTSEDRLQRLGQHLDELAARATRAVADLRVQSQSIVDDVATWKEHLDLSRVDAELARMDVADDLRRARAAWEMQRTTISRRLDDAREDAAAALRALRETVADAARDLGEVLDFGSHAP
jgi:hypothetical protein